MSCPRTIGISRKLKRIIDERATAHRGRYAFPKLVRDALHPYDPARAVVTGADGGTGAAALTAGFSAAFGVSAVFAMVGLATAAVLLRARPLDLPGSEPVDA